MIHAVRRYILPLDTRETKTLALPAGAYVLSADIVLSAVHIWALVDCEDTARWQHRRFRVVTTNQAFDGARDAIHIATIRDDRYPGASVAWHIFEVFA